MQIDQSFIGILIFAAIIVVGAVIFYLSKGRKTPAHPATPKPLDKPETQAPSASSTDAPSTDTPTPVPAPAPTAWDRALKKSREPLLGRLRDSLKELTSSEPWNSTHPVWESMEASLLGADLGPGMTERLLETLKKNFPRKTRS